MAAGWMRIPDAWISDNKEFTYFVKRMHSRKKKKGNEEQEGA
jgi:hypothetical protein